MDSEKQAIDNALIASDFEDLYFDGEPNDDTLAAMRETSAYGAPEAVPFDDFAALISQTHIQTASARFQRCNTP